MPANRTVASLSIALIVFVMLTFVLAVTTYLFFKQRLDEQAKAEAAIADVNKARTDLNAALDDKRKLQELLGAEEDKTVADIEAETNARFASDFAGFTEEPKSYAKLVDWLAEAVKTKDGQMNSQRQDQEKQLAERDQSIESQKKAVAQAQSDKDKAIADADAEKKKFDEARKAHEDQQNKLTADQQQALDESTAFERLRQEVAKAGQFLAPPQRSYKEDELRKGKTAIANAVKDFESKPDPEGKLGVIYEVLRSQQAVINWQNEALAKLRAADQSVQAAVLAATPKDERIDGFDGRIISVNEVDHTALVGFGSTAGLRPGLLFAVYDPAEPRPQLNARKAEAEVISVESPSLARVRLRGDSVRNPVLSGDGIASGLWSTGASPEVVIVGFVQLDGDTAADVDSLTSLIERVGGRVADSVSPSTSMVIDAGNPKSIGGSGAAAPGWRPVDEKRRDTQIKSARQLGVRVVGVNGALEMLGVTRQQMETGSLPRRDESRLPPVRAGNLAY